MIAQGEEPLQLDGVTFTAEQEGYETARRGDELIGELRPGTVDEGASGWWRVRKRDAFGDWLEWKDARSASEARAYIVSKVRE